MSARALTMAELRSAAGEPDPAEVEDIAAAIREAFQPDGTLPTEWERKAARAALARIREREAGR